MGFDEGEQDRSDQETMNQWEPTTGSKNRTFRNMQTLKLKSKSQATKIWVFLLVLQEGLRQARALSSPRGNRFAGGGPSVHSLRQQGWWDSHTTSNGDGISHLPGAVGWSGSREAVGIGAQKKGGMDAKHPNFSRTSYVNDPTGSYARRTKEEAVNCSTVEELPTKQ